VDRWKRNFLEKRGQFVQVTVQRQSVFNVSQRFQSFEKVEGYPGRRVCIHGEAEVLDPSDFFRRN
jgi:hypothetical protein